MATTNLYNDKNTIRDNQYIFDAFNAFIMSEDRNVFNKLYMRTHLYNMTKHLNGDIVECGVFKGSGMFTWLKLVDLNQPNSIKKVIGFDFFDQGFVDTLVNDVDRNTMKQVFTRVNKLQDNDISLEGISNKILNAGFKHSKFDLVKGDISQTSVEYVKERPGMRISLLYLDMDLEKPTYDALNAFWDRIVPGGVIVFDEYAYHSWSESNAVDKFIKDKDLFLVSTNVHAPTAYCVKQ